MKIVLISNSSWNLYNFRKELILYLLKNNFIIYTISPKDKYTKHLIKLGCKHIDLKISQYGKNLFYELKTIYNIYNLFRLIKPKYVLSFTIKPNLYSSFVCNRLKIKNISNISGLGNTFLNKNLIYFLTIFLYRIFLSHTHKILFQNKDDLEVFKNLNIIRKKNFDILPGSGINLDYFKCNDYELSKKNIHFLFIGRLIQTKGIEEFCIAATNILKNRNDINFSILSPATENFEFYKNKYKNLNFLSPVDDIRIFLRKSQCVVLPSYREGMPRSLLEASAMSVPMIASNVAGCRDIVIDGYNGLLCEHKSIQSLEHTLNKFISTSISNKITMSENARNFVQKKFDVNFVIKRYSELLK